MWKAYSVEYRKHNRAICASVMAAAFIAALFLSFLCGLFYNFWQDNIAGVIEEEGAWHGRITGEMKEADIALIRSMDHVEQVTIREDLSGEDGVVADITFHPVRSVLKDMPFIADKLNLREDEVAYHYQLLSLYLVRVPGDPYPRLVMPFYLAIIVLVCISMTFVIYNAFAFTMHTRVHQFGIFASVGATPRQIRICLLQEAFQMTILPIISGMFLGIICCYGVVYAINRMAEQIVGGRSAKFVYPPAILGLTFVTSMAAVLVAAWRPAKKMSRMTTLEAIRGSEEKQLVRKKHSPILSFLFGIEGELAGNALKAQKRAFRTATLSLTMSFVGFMLVQCFFTLSDISTEETYFARYQDAWDIMVTVHDTGIEEISDECVEKIREVSEVKDVAVYQKAKAVCKMPESWLSKELQALGGMAALTEGRITSSEGFMMVEAPVVVLDDESFRQYYKQTETRTDISSKEKTASAEGGIVINHVWDSLHSNFRNRAYVPFVRTDENTVMLGGTGVGKEMVEIPILAYTEEAPLLREEYVDYGLVQIMPRSYWELIKEQMGGGEQDTYIRILTKENILTGQMTQIEEEVGKILGVSYKIEHENRLMKKIRNEEMIAGYKLVLGGFCVLLAIIGIANVFSNTLGFLRLRKREVVRYFSVGLTPGGIRKVFALEALMIAGCPILITIPLVTALTGMMIRASDLDPMVFIKRAPVLQIMVFILLLLGFVGLAYYLGGKKVLRSNISETLRDDTL